MERKKPSIRDLVNGVIVFSGESQSMDELLDTIKPALETLVTKKFTGKLNLKFNRPQDGKVSVEVRISPKYAKTVTMSIYAKYRDFFEGKRFEFMERHHTEYGADKYAIDCTLKEIESKESIIITAANLKQAMTRFFTRRPLKTRSKD